MSINLWAKRSPKNLSAILAVTIAAICLNLYYRDRPESKADNTNSASAEIALSGTSPKVKAFLKMIRWAEGTDGIDGYKKQFTGTTFNDDSDHPREIRCTVFDGKKLCSDASGAYQILSVPTWDGQWVDGEKRIGLKEKLKLKDFSQKSQDLAAIDLLNDAGAIALIEKDDIAGAISASCKTWASLPCSSDDLHGAYGQSVKPMKSLLQRFKENLN
jgi:muramidase (phage lysozyme)